MGLKINHESNNLIDAFSLTSSQMNEIMYFLPNDVMKRSHTPSQVLSQIWDKTSWTNEMKVMATYRYSHLRTMDNFPVVIKGPSITQEQLQKFINDYCQSSGLAQDDSEFEKFFEEFKAGLDAQS